MQLYNCKQMWTTYSEKWGTKTTNDLKQLEQLTWKSAKPEYLTIAGTFNISIY